MESPESLQTFYENTLAGPLKTAGVPEVQPQIMPVHNHIEGRGTEAGTIVVVEIACLSADDYDRITADIEAHSGDGGAPKRSSAASPRPSSRRGPATGSRR